MIDKEIIKSDSGSACLCKCHLEIVDGWACLVCSRSHLQGVFEK